MPQAEVTPPAWFLLANEWLSLALVPPAPTGLSWDCFPQGSASHACGHSAISQPSHPAALLWAPHLQLSLPCIPAEAGSTPGASPAPQP